MGKVRILPPHIANQIAAGEVVERPASVVKELVENSLDAGARRISIEVEDGGKRLIRVQDDGCGMGKDDLILSVEPHATSKIFKEKDLYNINTLGFRGEALASIGAVSRLKIVSRPSGQPEGWMVQVVFGREKKVSAVGCPTGTVVEVEDIFEEIPARRRFLKKRHTELGHINNVVRTLAAANPGVFFQLFSKGKELLSCSAGREGADIVEPLLGQELIPRLLEVRGGSRAVKVEGYVTRPEDARTNPKGFYFFLNGRPIKSRLLWKAVTEGARGFFMKGAYPAGAIFVQVPPDLVDVNVHPSKQEVRFEQSSDIYTIVYHGIRRAFEGIGNCVIENTFHDDQVSERPSIPWKTTKEERSQVKAGGNTDNFFKDKPDDLGFLVDLPKSTVDRQSRGETGETLKVIGQLADSYILAEGDSSLVIVDQHAAHEGLLFKKIQDRIEGEGRIEGQPLVFPMVIERSMEQVERLLDVAPILDKAGMEIVAFGPEQVAVRKLPEFVVENSEPLKIIDTLFDRLLASPDQTPATLLHEVAASMACHSAIKANHNLKREEMEALLKELVSERVTHCPHGRPIFYSIDLDTIRRRLGRG